jgi:hypothetical protein
MPDGRRGDRNLIDCMRERDIMSCRHRVSGSYGPGGIPVGQARSKAFGSLCAKWSNEGAKRDKRCATLCCSHLMSVQSVVARNWSYTTGCLCNVLTHDKWLEWSDRRVPKKRSRVESDHSSLSQHKLKIITTVITYCHLDN